jgi:hypothetical protein
LIKHWQRNPPPAATANSTIVLLHGKPVELGSSEGCRFVADCTRSAEGLTDDETLQKIYEIDAKSWKKREKNKRLIDAIREERTRRVRTGQAAREAAQQHFIKAPRVLDSIMSDEQANARHRIEAAREIRQVAVGADGAENTTDAAEKFVITINLGADHVERIEKEITPKKSPQLIEGEANASEE